MLDRTLATPIIDTGYVTKINLKTRKTPHMSQPES